MVELRTVTKFFYQVVDDNGCVVRESEDREDIEEYYYDWLYQKLQVEQDHPPRPKGDGD